MKDRQTYNKRYYKLHKKDILLRRRLLYDAKNPYKKNRFIEVDGIAHAVEPFTVGMSRVNKIIQEERDAGFNAWGTGRDCECPDIFVHDNNSQLVRVYEVTNYAKPTYYFDKARTARYLRTLLSFNCHRILVASFLSNVGDTLLWTDNDIEIMIRGEQE